MGLGSVGALTLREAGNIVNAPSDPKAVEVKIKHSVKLQRGVLRFVLPVCLLLAAAVPKMHAATATWTNYVTTLSDYWTNSVNWNAATYPGGLANDESAYLTNPVGVAYTNILDFNFNRRIATLAISNTLGEAWLIVTNATLTNTTFALNSGGRLQVDSGGIFSNTGTAFTWLGTNGAIYLNDGGKLFTAAAVTIGTGSSMTGLVTSTSGAGNGGVWNLLNQTLTIGSGVAGVGNVLTIDGGILTNMQLLYVGNSGAARNSLVVSNGAKLSLTFDLYAGGNGLNRSNSVTLGGLGDVVTVSAGRAVVVGQGNGASYNTLTVTNANVFGFLHLIRPDNGSGGTNNTATLYTNTLWNGNSGTLNVGSVPQSVSNSLVINGAVVSNLSASAASVVGGNLGSFGNSLTVSNGGQLYWRNNLVIGNLAGANSNAYNVGGLGAMSTVSNATLIIGVSGGSGNTMTVTNANLFSGSSVAIGQQGSSNNSVSVLAGATWNIFNNGINIGHSTTPNGNVNNQMTVNGGTVTNAGTVILANAALGFGNSLTISNGGKFFSSSVLVGNFAGSTNNSYNVGGFGLSSTVSNGAITVGIAKAGFNTMTVTNTTLQSGAVTIGSGSSNNTVTVLSDATWDMLAGALTVGADAATGNVLRLEGTAAIINIGTLRLTNNLNQIRFNGGTLSMTAAFVSNQVFTVGDGTQRATLDALAGGINTFGSGLLISSNATLQGVGTIRGTTILTNGGVIAPGNSPGTINVQDMIWYGGGIYSNDVINFTSGPGVGWDYINGAGSLVFSNNAANFIIRLDSGGGPAANFDSSLDYALVIAGFANGITNFNSITVDTSAFANPFGGSFGTMVSGTNLYLTYNGLSVTPNFTWTNAVSGSWSSNEVWLGVAAPPTNGSAAQVLQFNGGGSTAYIATNDRTSTGISGIFTNNKIVFNSTASATNVLAGATLTFIGSDAGLYQQAGGAFIVSNAIVMAGNMVVRGSGSGTVILTNTITGTGQLTKLGTGFGLVLHGSNSFAGPVLVNGGTLTLQNQYALGMNSITVSNGTVFVNTGSQFNFGFGTSQQNLLITGAGSTWTNGNALTVGRISGASQSLSNSLTVDNGASLRVAGGIRVGEGASAVFESMFNSLIVTNGGQVFKTGTAGSYVGDTASSNLVKIVGGGTVGTTSVWNNGGGSTFYVGYAGGTGNRLIIDGNGVTGGALLTNLTAATALVVGDNTTRGSGGNSLVITNGGRLIVGGAAIIGNGASNNLATVSDNGSWNNGNQSLTIGSGAATGNVLRVGADGVVTNISTLVIGTGAARSNVVQLSGGTVWATSVIATSVGNRVAFDAGTLGAGTLTYSNSAALVVGDGSSAATLILGSGNHSFQQGIELRNNSYLKGTNNATLGALITNTLISGAIAIGADAGNTFTINGPIVGTATTLTKQDGGTVVLRGTNTYTGTTLVNAGTLTIGNTAGTGISAAPVTVSGGNFVVNNTGATSTGLGVGLTVSSGSAFITNTAGTGVAANVAVNGGNLFVNNTGGTAVSAGQTVTIGGGTVAGNGSIAGAVVLNSGGTLTAGNNSIDTLTMGSLNLNGGNLVVGFNNFTGQTNDQWTVTDSGGLTINGGTVLLYTNNSTVTFDQVGTYQLIGYSGSIGGPGVAGLSVGNPTGNRTYTFSELGGYVILGIGGTGVGWNPGYPLGDTWWTNAANWGGGGGPAPVAGEQLLFDGNVKRNNTNNFASNTQFAGIVFANSAGAFVLNPMAAGTNVVNLTGNVVNYSGNQQTINLPLVLDGATRAFNTLNGNIVVNGAISGSVPTAGLLKQGSQRLELTGVNTYSGNTDIQNGVLRATHGVGLPTASNLRFNGGVFESAGNFTRATGTVAGAVQWTGSGGFSAYGGTLTVNLSSAAPLTWGSGAFVPGGSTLKFSSADANSTVVFVNPLDLNAAVRTIEVANGSTWVDADLTGIVSGGVGGLTKTGTGTLRLSGNQTYSGAISVNSGGLIVNASISGGADLSLASGTSLSGTGTLGRVISGAGTVAPGSSPGILTVNQVNPGGGLDFNFEFTNIGSPNYTAPGASLNDVLRITNSTPFTTALGLGNTVNLYVSGVTLTPGITNWFRGGFYTDTAANFDGSITNATFNWYFNNALQGAPLVVRTVDETSTPTQFGGINGWVMEFGVPGETVVTSVIPEPNVLMFWLSGAVVVYAARRRGRRQQS
ncbi:MAG: hypothetical protein PCFJNLEI_00651 [Verrucomicrobiae bacterium]|nr:hypothetical protein [Verrucomicrobiae bacterium]